MYAAFPRRSTIRAAEVGDAGRAEVVETRERLLRRAQHRPHEVRAAARRRRARTRGRGPARSRCPACRAACARARPRPPPASARGRGSARRRRTRGPHPAPRSAGRRSARSRPSPRGHAGSRCARSSGPPSPRAMYAVSAELSASIEPVSSSIGEDELGGTLADHDRRGVGVAGRDTGDDRCVRDAEAADAAHTQLRIHD